MSSEYDFVQKGTLRLKEVADGGIKKYVRSVLLNLQEIRANDHRLRFVVGFDCIRTVLLQIMF